MVYNTKNREKIISFLSNNAGDAYTAEEICSHILDGDGGKSTVYRLLSRLVDEGAIQRITDTKTRRVSYQCAAGNCREHLHLKCKECGKLIHLDEMTSHILEKRIFNTKGFTLDVGGIIYGSCDGCTGGAR